MLRLWKMNNRLKETERFRSPVVERVTGITRMLTHPPSFASFFSRLGPLAIRQFTELSHLTLAPVRVRFPIYSSNEKDRMLSGLFHLWSG